MGEGENMRVSARWKRELIQVARFILVGCLTVLCYLAIYTLLSRVFWPTGIRWIQNAIATGIVAVANFYGHRFWTFRSQASVAKSGIRYIIVLVTASVLQVFLFWVGHSLLRLHDLLVAVVVPALIPCYTFVMHRLYTFRATPSLDRRSRDILTP